MCLSQIFLLCYFGDLLLRSSTEISGAIYNCQWYNTDIQMKKDLLLVLKRSQKPCKLTAANFADLNLRAFTTILSRSWSVFALLKSIYK
uniref:Odorant receptor n=1 Tax=Eogystia hippophaecolus TaxID=1206364 RepID=A0A1B3P5U6_EOGHI|nr:odorant receptor [Eogystia hippophaecolus]